MKKELIIVTIILIIMIILNVTTQKYTAKKIDLIGTNLEEISTLATDDLKNETKNNVEEINKKMEDTNNKWNEVNKKLAFYIEHDELEKISTSIVTIKEYLNLENYEEAVPEIKKCIFILEHLEEKGVFTVVNLF